MLRIFISFFVGIASSLSAFYLKVGGINPPGDSEILPCAGVGKRFRKDQYGLDLSATVGSLRYFSLKGLGVFYPNRAFYAGIGPGIGYLISSDSKKAVQRIIPGGGAPKEWGFISVEAVLGYEFQRIQKLKPFVQLELSQPIITLSGQKKNHRPGVAFSAGVEF